MADLQHPNQLWADFVNDACERLGLDASEVDVTLLHELSRDVAHTVDRPLAPVSTYLLGLAVGLRAGRGEPADDAVRRELASRIPLGE